MRIVCINRFYRPDYSATSQLLTDLAEHMAAGGTEVQVITSRELYEGGERLSSREVLAGVAVKRVWTSNFGRSWLPGRMCDYATFYWSAFWSLLFSLRRGDVVLAKTDPPLISVVAAAAARIKGASLVNWCQDLFPEIAGALGLKWAARWPGRVLRRLRNWSLKVAVFNVALHARMAEELERAGVKPEAIAILPNWADPHIVPVARDQNPVRTDWGLLDRMVIGYSGNLGRAHMPEKVADLVRATMDVENLTWLFVGSGHGIDLLKEAVADRANVVFKPYQPRETLSATLSAADIHLVTLNPDCEGFIVPSKLYGALAARRPVLFLGHSDGAVARDIRALEAGWVLDPTQPETWHQVVVRAIEAIKLRPSAGLEKAAIPSASDALANWSKLLLRSTNVCSERLAVRAQQEQPS